MTKNIKRIVFVINDLKGNGAERVVLTLADQFMEQGHQCHIVCFKPLRELPSRNSLNIHHFKQYYRWIPRVWRGAIVARFLDAFIKKNIGTPDLVLSNLLPSDRVLSHSRLLNVFLIIHNTMSLERFSGAPPQHSKHYTELKNIYTAKPTVCVSKGVMEDFINVFNPHLTTTSIYNPIDATFVRSQSQQSNPITYSNYLVCVAKFNSAKRHDILIQAYAKSGVTLPLVLVGQGPLKEQTMQLVDHLRLSDRVIFAGFHSNPYPIIKNATGLIVPSDYEGLGMVILEAIALGTPVISTDCPSGPNEILPAKNLSPVQDIDALAHNITQLSRNPDAYVIELGSHFSPEFASKRYLDLIAH